MESRQENWSALEFPLVLLVNFMMLLRGLSLGLPHAEVKLEVSSFAFSTMHHCSNFLSFSFSVKMQNEAGENVDLYVPRKCSWTNRLIVAKDHSSIQINVANVDPVTGLATGENTPYALSGYIRFKSEGDMALTALVQKNDAVMFASSN